MTETLSRAPVEAPDAGGAAAERLTGIEALVRVLTDQAAADARAGLTTGGFVSGYPGSPIGRLHDVLEARSAELAERRIVHSPGLNEELAATAVWGSQTVTGTAGATVDGVFGMWYAKAPGVDRAGDALRHGAIRGAAPYGGVLVVAGDDPKPNATMYPSDSTLAFHAWGMPVLYPSSVQEVRDLGLHGYALSRAAGVWVGFKMVTSVADGTGPVRDTPVTPQIPTVTLDGVPFSPRLRVNDAGELMKDAERDLHAARLRLAAEYIRQNRLNPVVVDPAGATTGIVAAGPAYAELRRALDRLGVGEADLRRRGVRLKKVMAPYPIAGAEWEEFADGLTEILVVEEKRPILEPSLKDALYGRTDRPTIVGKTDESGAEFLPVHGEITTGLLTRRFAERWGLSAAVPRSRPAPLPLLTTSRTGFFCSACPHNTGLKAPEGASVGAGIGCHLLGLFAGRPEHGEISGYTQMGGEGAQWLGMAPFTNTPHLVQNVGDGTFHHSASLAVRAAVAGGVNVTYKLLYNGTVGMTGGQDVRGGMTVPAMARMLLAEGVTRVVVTSDDPGKYRRRDLPRGVRVRPREEIVAVQEELAALPGVTVLIHDQMCAAEKRRWQRRTGATPTKRVMINERVCEACGDCSRTSQCLSVQPVETEFGRKTTIHQSSCNTDYTCAAGDCPSFLTVETKDATRRLAEIPEAPPAPEPTVVVPTDSFSIHMTGIGGTGVISVSQMLGAAATLEGRRVRSLDLTGSTIKAGPVVSQLQVVATGEPPAGIADGGADLFLAFDLLAGMTPANLAPAGADRTVVVASSAVTPTAQMAVDPTVRYPSTEELRSTLDATSRADHNVYLDVEALAQSIVGTHMAANALLVGVAHQAGALPLRAESIEQAIRDQGTAVEQNLAAFRWGRAVVADPALAERLGSRPTGRGAVDARTRALVDRIGATGELARLLEIRIPDLAEYQNAAYARAYADVVADVAAAERTVDGDGLALAVARHLHRVMAYKDEYEVARLHLLDSVTAAVEAEFGAGARVSWNLHPPVLRYLGMDRKITFGPWFRPALGALRAMRKVRGTPVDVFSRSRVRRVERALVAHHTALCRAVAVGLTSENLAVRTALVDAIGEVRGYEEIKMAAVVRYVETARPLAVAAGVPFVTDGLAEAAR
ncbi:indolepyruvate ferredoxin oxidoreductase family protein [Pseudonocardia sp. RS010]|uniref:indolepyruvate ferredoxin oxidoreductase family protein n=1 Tax=Pseudonocardia sp. RS010 TaxID=3385979 RepID=UPI0039A21F88